MQFTWKFVGQMVCETARKALRTRLDTCTQPMVDFIIIIIVVVVVVVVILLFLSKHSLNPYPGSSALGPGTQIQPLSPSGLEVQTEGATQRGGHV